MAVKERKKHLIVFPISQETQKHLIGIRCRFFCDLDLFKLESSSSTNLIEPTRQIDSKYTKHIITD